MPSVFEESRDKQVLRSASTTDWCRPRSGLLAKSLPRLRCRSAGNPPWVFPSDYAVCYNLQGTSAQQDTPSSSPHLLTSRSPAGKTPGLFNTIIWRVPSWNADDSQATRKEGKTSPPPLRPALPTGTEADLLNERRFALFLRQRKELHGSPPAPCVLAREIPFSYMWYIRLC